LLLLRSGEAVVAAAGLLVAVPLAGVAAVAAGALGRLACALPWGTPVVAGLGVLALAALGPGVWCAVSLTVPSGRSRVGGTRR
jgi:ABC-type uncharacterized transport system permease subunit